METIICSKDCYQFKKGYCYIADFGKPCKLTNKGVD